jgi:hypothetical protein
VRAVIGLAVCAAAGCGFPGNGAGTAPVDGESPPGTIDSPLPPPAIDAPRPPDAVVDAFVADAAWCNVATDPQTDQSVGRVGANGGAPVADLRCDDDDEIIVGVAIEMSNQNTANDGRSARGLRIACAPITLVDSGAPIVGSDDLNDVRGNGTSGWSPSTRSAVTRCPTGWVVAGLEVYTGSGIDENRFIDLTIVCAELGPGAVPTGQRMDLYVAGSLDEDSGNERAECATGEVLRLLEPNTGAGLDSVGLVCAQPGC